MSNTYREWPENDEPASFAHIADPIVRSIRFAYQLTRKNENRNIPWEGLNIGKGQRAMCHSPFELLSVKGLEFSLEDQGREAIEELVGLAVQLGIEQGRRIESTERMRVYELRMSMYKRNPKEIKDE